MIIKRPRQAVLTPCGLPARMVFRAYRPPSDLLSVAKMVRLLFSNSEQGAVYDPSDLSTLFQDSVGTTPVTAVEQPVGLVLDKSGRGNHASQATTTKRPIYSRRVNLLTKTEQFDDAAWVKQNCSPAPNAILAPDGTLSADKLTEDSSTSVHRLEQTITVVAGSQYVMSFYVKAAERSWVRVYEDSANSGGYFNVGAGTTGTATGGAVLAISQAGNGWFKCSITYTQSGSFGRVRVSPAIADVVSSYAGDGISGVYIWGASLVLAIDANLPYQRVNTATDYDADPAKFPAYLRFDGVDDAMQTGSIDFTGTDNVTVWAGVEKLSDYAIALIASSGVSSGSFELFGPRSSGGGQRYAFATRNGSIIEAISVTERSAPDAAVLTGISNTSGGVATLRRNGVDLAVSTPSPSGVNHGNYPLSIGARAGNNLFFNGRLYSLIVRGAQSSQAQVEAPEAFMRGRMKL